MASKQFRSLDIHTEVFEIEEQPIPCVDSPLAVLVRIRVWFDAKGRRDACELSLHYFGMIINSFPATDRIFPLFMRQRFSVH